MNDRFGSTPAAQYTSRPVSAFGQKQPFNFWLTVGANASKTGKYYIYNKDLISIVRFSLNQSPTSAFGGEKYIRAIKSRNINSIVCRQIKLNFFS